MNKRKTFYLFQAGDLFFQIFISINRMKAHACIRYDMFTVSDITYTFLRVHRDCFIWKWKQLIVWDGFWELKRINCYKPSNEWEQPRKSSVCVGEKPQMNMYCKLCYHSLMPFWCDVLMYASYNIWATKEIREFPSKNQIM